MNTEAKRITPTVAAHVLWCYDEPGGMEPGSFIRFLIKLIGRADPANRYKLSLGFPEYVAACQEIETPGSGAEALRVIAEKLQEEPPAAEPLIKHECHQTAGGR